MIKRYRKKPVVISAAQYVGGDDNIAAILKFGRGNIGYLHANKTLKINTLEGTMEASLGDFIIEGTHGEFYSCKPEIFVKAYELVGSAVSDIPSVNPYDAVKATKQMHNQPYNPHKKITEQRYSLNTGPDIL